MEEKDKMQKAMQNYRAVTFVRLLRRNTNQVKKQALTRWESCVSQVRDIKVKKEKEVFKKSKCAELINSYEKITKRYQQFCANVSFDWLYEV